MLRSLEEPSVIVMDNAAYHSRVENRLPKSYWKKEQIVQFLTEQGMAIQDPGKLTKTQLIDLISSNAEVNKNTVSQRYSNIGDKNNHCRRLIFLKAWWENFTSLLDGRMKNFYCIKI